jgi:hypothetical protein
MSEDKLLSKRNFSILTLAGLKEVIDDANKGRFGLPDDGEEQWGVTGLLAYLHRTIKTLPERTQTAVRLRHGKVFWATDSIGQVCGNAFGQTVEVWLKNSYRVLLRGGPRVQHVLDAIAKQCTPENPLTADRLKAMVGRWTLKESPEFYVSLLGHLHRGIPFSVKQRRIRKYDLLISHGVPLDE